MSSGVEIETLPLSDRFVTELKSLCDDYISINSERFDIREVEVSAIIALLDHVFKILCRHRQIESLIGFGAAISFVLMFVQEMRDRLPEKEKPKFNKTIAHLINESMNELGLK